MGNVPGQIRLPGNKIAVFHYMLYKKGNKKQYELVLTHNKDLLVKYYATLHLTISLEKFICQTHKLWHEVIQPWLDRDELHYVYKTDLEGKSQACKYITH